MSEVKDHYNNRGERATSITLREAQGLVLYHDDFDPDWQVGDEPHGTLTFDNPIPKTPEEVYQDQLRQEFNDAHIAAIAALKNWGTLTAAQKDVILKNLLKWALWKDDRLHLGVL